jgi:hypothetical protein
MAFNDPRKNPVQGTEKRKLTKEEAVRVNLRRWLAEKNLRDAEHLARQGMQGYR